MRRHGERTSYQRVIAARRSSQLWVAGGAGVGAGVGSSTGEEEAAQQLVPGARGRLAGVDETPGAEAEAEGSGYLQRYRHEGMPTSV